MGIPLVHAVSTTRVSLRVDLSGKDEQEESDEKRIKVWVLRCKRTGHILYLEVFKDFLDVLLSFLTLRTGAVIKLIQEAAPMMKTLNANSDRGIFNVYQSLKKLDEGLLEIDRDLLLNPVQSLRVSEELWTLKNHDFECCNADCPKYLAGSRRICRNCTISTHFSCITCGGYFRENAHTSLCYTPWRPWGNHASAAPVLTRYTVVESCNSSSNCRGSFSTDSHSRGTNDEKSTGGFVKGNIPFIITNELQIHPLSTSTVSQLLRKYGIGSCEELECNKICIGISEVIVLLGAAMVSSTPLTDVFGSMCNHHTKVPCSLGSITCGAPILVTPPPVPLLNETCTRQASTGTTAQDTSNSHCDREPGPERVARHSVPSKLPVIDDREAGHTTSSNAPVIDNPEAHSVSWKLPMDEARELRHAVSPKHRYPTIEDSIFQKDVEGVRAAASTSRHSEDFENDSFSPRVQRSGQRPAQRPRPEPARELPLPRPVSPATKSLPLPTVKRPPPLRAYVVAGPPTDVDPDSTI